MFARFKQGLRKKRLRDSGMLEFPSADAVFRDVGEPTEPPMKPLKEANVLSPICNLCGRQHGFEVLHEEIPQIDTPSSVVQCPDCGLVFLSPRLAEITNSWWNARAYLTDCLLPELATQKRMPEPMVMSLSENDRHYAAVLRAIEHVREERGENAKLMDAGASLGLLVLAARRTGWHAVGLEPSQVVATYGAKVLDVTVDVGTVGELRHHANQYDCITLTDVLEHTFDPFDALQSALTALRPGGTLFLSVPNFEAASRKKAGAGWAQFVSDHYYHFTGDTLGGLLQKAGFVDVLLRVDHPLPFGELPTLPANQASGSKDLSWLSQDRSAEALFAWGRKPAVA